MTTNVPKNKRLSISYVFPQFFFYRKSQSKETEVWCESCRFGDLNTKATHFCKTCEDLEPLCENCAQQHVRHKLCRGHEICNGIEEFLDMKEALDKKYVFFNFIFFKFYSQSSIAHNLCSKFIFPILVFTMLWVDIF